MQNSRLFPDFFQNNNFFFQTQGYQIKTLEKLKEQGFFHGALQTYREDWIRFDQHEKNFTCKALIVTFKTTQYFLPFFQDFISIFQTFSRSGKLLGKFQDLFKGSRLCKNSDDKILAKLTVFGDSDF